MRNKVFDVIRGVAIVLMVLANAAPIHPDQFPFAMRILFSIPAPMFIFISGLMLAFGAHKHPFSYFVKRALFILGIAALIDIGIHQLIPFQGFDVLYLIGFSMPLVILALRLSVFTQALLVLGILFLGELARWHFGYASTHHSDVMSLQSMGNYLVNLDIKQFLTEGDFPMLPWTSVMLFGGLIGKLYVESKDANYFQRKFFKCLTFSLIMLGALLMTFYRNSEFIVVNGYAELFYPPFAGLLICLVCVPLILLAFSPYIQQVKLLGELGRSSLAIYIVHLLLIHLSITILGAVTTLLAYCVLFIWHFTLVYFFSNILVKFKNSRQKMPVLVAWLIGT